MDHKTIHLKTDLRRRLLRVHCLRVEHDGPGKRCEAECYADVNL